MIQKQNKNELNENTKDFLYKIGKVKQNRILYEKDKNTDYNQQQKNVKNVKQPDEQDQIDFQLCLPSNIQPNYDQKQFDSSTIQDNIPKYSFDNQAKRQNQPPKNQKADLINQQNMKQSKNQEVKQQKSKTFLLQQSMQNKTNKDVCYKPFVFDDFQQQLCEQQVSKQQQTETNHKKAIGLNLGSQKQQGNKQLEKNRLNSKKDIRHMKRKQAIVDHQESGRSQSSQQQEQIKGVKLVSNYNSMDGNVIVKITNKKQLVSSSLPPGIILKCIIRRSKDIFNPQFDFYLNNGLKHLMSAKKYSLAKKEIFKLSTEIGQYRTKDVISTVMTNTVHNIYWIYRQNNLKNHIQYETQGVIKYGKTVKNKQREMQVNLFVENWKKIIADPKKLGHQIPQQPGIELKNIQLQSKQSSVKNYNLCDQQDKQYQYLKMNKVSQNMFQVQIQHPLSPLQAFAISLSRFDAQLN